MLDREPFLQAIFAARDDDLPRLVFADWLDEHGDAAWAELIRIGCERERLPARDVLNRGRLLATHDNLLRAWRRDAPAVAPTTPLVRGFNPHSDIVTSSDDLTDAAAFRVRACRDHPEWYGATRLTLFGTPVVTPTPLVTILTSPVTANVTELDLSGREVEAPVSDDPVAREFGLIDFTRHPAINTLMVEELAGMRECRRLTALDLRNNDLGNDALRALADSPYFTRLTRLRLFDGNRFRGRPWQRVTARFGDVVE